MNPEAIADLLLSSTNPREAARRILAWLLEYAGAESASVWSEDGPTLLLAFGMAVDAETLATVQDVWSREGDSLRRGAVVTRGHRALLPCSRDGLYVCLEGANLKGVDLDTVRTIATVVTRALRTPRAPSPAGGADEARRSELLSTLSVHDWNISRVARAKGVTRKTVYDWMTKLNIQRERVVKS
jgi:hypothetical protein